MSPAHVDTWRVHLNNKFHALMDSLSESDETNSLYNDEVDEDFSGDIAPGTLESPQALPKASTKEAGFLDRLCAMFHRAESSFGYEGKELELRRPGGVPNWKQSFGNFKRRAS